MASSDSIIRNVYRQVTGSEADDSVLRAARAIPDDQLAGFFSSGGVAQYMNSPENYIESMREVVREAYKPYEEAAKRAGEFEEQNPFSFDDALARASAEERFDPYYENQLRDFETGIIRARGRTNQDEERLRRELTRSTEQFVGRARRDINEALSASQEGYAGSGLFFSGARERDEGLTTIRGEEGIRDYERKQRLLGEESTLRQQRNLEDVALREATGRREMTAARETDILTDIAKQRTEAQQQRELERQNYIGYPLSTGTSSLRTILGV